MYSGRVADEFGVWIGEYLVYGVAVAAYTGIAVWSWVVTVVFSYFELCS